MNRKIIIALLGLILLFFAAGAAQSFLSSTVRELDDSLAAAERGFAEDDLTAGRQSLQKFLNRWEETKIGLTILSNDADIHAIDRGAARAMRLAEEGEAVLAAEEVSDLRETLEDLMRFNVPPVDNLLKIRFSVEKYHLTISSG